MIKRAGNVEEFVSVSKRVAAMLIKLNRRYRLKMVKPMHQPSLAKMKRLLTVCTRMSNHQ